MGVAYWRQMCVAYSVVEPAWLGTSVCQGRAAASPGPPSPVPMGLPLTPEGAALKSRRAMACMAQLVATASADVAAAFGQVPPERMEEMVRAMASILGQQVLVSEQESWTAEVVVPVVVGRLAMRLSASGRSLCDMMAAKLAAYPQGDGVARLPS
jgi:hypothetical protein